MAKTATIELPTSPSQDIQRAIEVHEQALRQSIREAPTQWPDGRILMLTQTLEVLRRMA